MFPTMFATLGVRFNSGSLAPMPMLYSLRRRAGLGIFRDMWSKERNIYIWRGQEYIRCFASQISYNLNIPQSSEGTPPDIHKPSFREYVFVHVCSLRLDLYAQSSCCRHCCCRCHHHSRNIYLFSSGNKSSLIFGPTLGKEKRHSKRIFLGATYGKYAPRGG